MSRLPVGARARSLFEQVMFKGEYAHDYGMPQWLATAEWAIRPLALERLFLGRHKFHHFRTFYRDELADYVREILLDARSKSRPHLNGRFLETMIDGHTRGYRNYTIELQVLSCELVYRLLIEQQ
jgi:asparagine synthase (glutamine-hydrolysing)